MHASMMGAYAIDLLADGKSNRVVAYKNCEYIDLDIKEALAMTKDIDDYQIGVSRLLETR
jgi:6-phosphofructokinase 1